MTRRSVEDVYIKRDNFVGREDSRAKSTYPDHTMIPNEEDGNLTAIGKLVILLSLTLITYHKIALELIVDRSQNIIKIIKIDSNVFASCFKPTDLYSNQFVMTNSTNRT